MFSQQRVKMKLRDIGFCRETQLTANPNHRPSSDMH